MSQCVARLSNNTTSITEAFVNKYVLPTELVVGFIAQFVNLLVLRQHKIRSITYTNYLRSLSIIYLISSPLLLIAMVRKTAVLPQDLPFFIVFYFAHFERFLINVFLFAGNLTVAAIAVESVRALVNPFLSYQQASHARNHAITLSAIMLSMACILSPLLFKDSVHWREGRWCIAHDATVNFHTYQSVIAAFFELFLVVLVAVLYAIMYYIYRKAVMPDTASSGTSPMPRRHQGGSVILKVDRNRNSKSREETLSLARGTMQSTPLTLRSTAFKSQSTQPQKSHQRSTRKAVHLCLGCVLAYAVSNALSAVKELLSLLALVTGSEALNQLLKGESRAILVAVTNATLLFNFTLTVVLQYYCSRQYRSQVHKLMNRLWRPCITLYNHMWISTHTDTVAAEHKSLDATVGHVTTEPPVAAVVTQGECSNSACQHVENIRIEVWRGEAVEMRVQIKQGATQKALYDSD